MIEYKTFENQLPEAVSEAVLTLHFQVFDGQERADLVREINEAPHLLTLIAYENDAAVGYKMGYRRKERHFYSWLGCVLPSHRGQGIASQLMTLQHDWCRANGYHTIRTMTYNKWRNMLILNLKHSFNIVGILADNAGEPKIILEKKLP
ncbi:GNAT family N-acetyltransferase [Runella slithyformis]|uniref:GCN5-related N-acetyltransferase n=1 Tax=Runella slithyformis (strain ATCC 29530 / DSM 19594 / LMG 11500 / NCIMB 11436 / LSU 4) TaxID=761193 RepID=A0A7U3ZG15_RUNSL|nr:GNAT family N-acetyltransferase [Runella slithyformis]AEI46465.1 GCN5-related N-acetyltransferase [Runella slithyformis DSM 19594]